MISTAYYFDLCSKLSGLAKFKQIVQDADQYTGLDGKVIFIVGEEAPSFFGGQKSAEEVAKLIQNRTTTFINE
ncbi:hypothetical protein G8C92_30390 [Paenibacillus donghaensis]|uniref:hypothetical protein n=1 Tax=Paenibacillus donghaensis TaxID=414771 RepID=UPI001883CA32|nr:hypothetical protein [Paenibacillus donghaensis]MBE9918311.1 hypothetical protein [Paenibacillus donghaensis]